MASELDLSKTKMADFKKLRDVTRTCPVWSHEEDGIGDEVMLTIMN
jgi:hypothetical protein